MATRLAAGTALIVALLALPCAKALAVGEMLEAARAGDGQRAIDLLRDGADPNALEPNGTAALHWAVYREDVELVRALLEAGADANAANEFSATPMSEAAAVANTQIIRLLLEAGADPESPNIEGQTAVMAVARTGNVEAARLLLEAGADPDVREGWSGQTALMWAAARGHPDMVRLLIEHGADPDARATVRNWDRRVTAEPRPKDLHRGGLTPLLYAAREGCVRCAQALVEGGADINLSDPDRVSPLVIALNNMRFDTAAYLISAGADVNRWDLYGRTPLYSAVDMSTLPRGGRPDVPSTDMTSAVQVIRLLLEAGADPNIQLKLRPPYRNVIFDRGGDNQLLTTGATPLLRASKAGDNPEVVRLLLEHGARLDLANANGITPVMAAAAMGHGNNPTRGRFNRQEDGIEVLGILLEAGGDANEVNRVNGQNGVHAAALRGWHRVIEYLVEHGADPALEDAQGRTPLDYARGDYPVFGPAATQPDSHDDAVAVLEAILGEPAAELRAN